MTAAVSYKLLAIFITVAIGWIAGRAHWLGTGTDRSDPARVLSNAAFFIFVPALLFRTTARLDFATMPWRSVWAYFVPAPALALLMAVYVWHRARATGDAQGAAAPTVRAPSASFGNSVQLGIALAAALSGEAGLAIHIPLVSLHALLLLSLTTALAEIDLTRAPEPGRAPASLAATMRATLRNTVIHPVVLPVVAGLVWNAGGLGRRPLVDESLVILGSAAVPTCLVLIGLSLAYYGVQGHLRGAIGLTLLKLPALPSPVLLVAHWGLGLSGLPLSMLAMMAALPVGGNPLIFAQRYGTLQAEARAAIAFSTLVFVVTAAGWLALLAWLG
jgi:predicted permease